MSEKNSNKSNGKLSDALRSIPKAFTFFGRVGLGKGDIQPAPMDIKK